MVTMLAEYGYQQFASPWSKDLTAYDTEPALPVCDEILLDLQTIELEDGILNEQNPYEHLTLLVDDDDTCSMGTSHLSSEFDEDITGDSGEMIGDDTGDIMFDTDAITKCLNVNSLHEITVQDIASLNGMEMFMDSMLGSSVTNNVHIGSDFGSSANRSSPSSSGSSAPSSPSSPRKRRRKLDNLPWSELGHDERERLLESISVSVSDVLGPREQLELLRIIDPDVQTLPHDGQFTIEPDFLDNEKLEKIRKLIDGHTTSSNQTGAHSACTSNSPNSRPGRTRNSLPKSSQKKKQSKELKLQRKTLRQQQRREYRQNLKEKRSGLFQKEEVLALEVHVEEEEIDILG